MNDALNNIRNNLARMSELNQSLISKASAQEDWNRATQTTIDRVQDEYNKGAARSMEAEAIERIPTTISPMNKEPMQNAHAEVLELSRDEVSAQLPLPTPSYLNVESGLKFGRRSMTELEGVKEELVELAHVALNHTKQDFMIFDGLRTLKEQKEFVRRGVSRTMRSKHLPQADGFSHAIDAVPVDSNGTPKWDWEMIYDVICAFDYAATRLGISDHIRWGGAWDRVLSDFGGAPEEYRKEVQAYANRNPGRDFLDGPHLEWKA